MRLRIILRHKIGRVSIGIPHLLFAGCETSTRATVHFDAIDIRLKISENCHLAREGIGGIRALDLSLYAFDRRQIVGVVGTGCLCEHNNATAQEAEECSKENHVSAINLADALCLCDLLVEGLPSWITYLSLTFRLNW